MLFSWTRLVATFRSSLFPTYFFHVIIGETCPMILADKVAGTTLYYLRFNRAEDARLDRY